MFYCDPCRRKRNYPESLCKTLIRCWHCNQKRICNETPQAELERLKEYKEKQRNHEA